MKKGSIMGLSVIVLILFSGCETYETEKPIITELGLIVGIKSYSDSFGESARCIVVTDKDIDVLLKGYYCNIAEEGKQVIKKTYKSRGGYSYTIIKEENEE